MSRGLLGILDIGKTHARFVTASAEEGVLTVDRCEVPRSLPSSVARQLDIWGIESWLVELIRHHPLRQRIRSLLPIAHGAAMVLVNTKGKVLVAPDYEDVRFDEVGESYRAERDLFETTYSPYLPLGLNLGRQLYYLKQKAPLLLAQAQHLLLYPQFWAWLLTGVAASELTSLGCHSDLWRPLKARPSDLAVRHGWSKLLPELRAASDSLGVISPETAELTGLNKDCKVLCGLHDSSASFLAHSRSRQDRPFAVVSSGTWTVVMARGASLSRVREGLDMLVNVDTSGAPVVTARFMGGREYQAIAGAEGLQAEPCREHLEFVVSRTILALPSFSAAGGPFANVSGRLVGAGHLTPHQRASLATLYLALMSDYLLSALDAQGEIIIDGPLAQNALYAEILAQLRPRSAVYVTRESVPATAIAAAFFNQSRESVSAHPTIAATRPVPGLQDYRLAWLSCLTSPVNE